MPGVSVGLPLNDCVFFVSLRGPRRRAQVVRERSAKPLCISSILIGAFVRPARVLAGASLFSQFCIVTEFALHAVLGAVDH